ncbi:MAG: T9SS type A sorting domain-containing protein [Ignavibacteria bacterium]
MNIKYKFIPTAIFALLIFLSNVTYSQASRKVLFEGFTNCCCGPCATYGPILDAFVASHPSTIVCLKYHTHGPGPDPMFWCDSVAIRYRYTQYYSILYVPTCKIDGVIQQDSPYSTESFTNYFNQRMAVSTPLNVFVNDVRVAGDSIKATVILNLSSDLPAGDYKLRVMAIERLIHYTSPPGTNGESDFAYCYRKSFPDVNGVAAPTTAGTYTYTYTYKRLPEWVDTSVITVAFVQNDVNTEIINSGQGHYNPLGIHGKIPVITENYALSQNYPNPFNPETNIKFSIPGSGNVTLKIYDILGNLVYTLVNGYLDAGSYNYEFSGANISSGIYYYKLTAGNFSETRKMILTK